MNFGCVWTASVWLLLLDGTTTFLQADSMSLMAGYKNEATRDHFTNVHRLFWQSVGVGYKNEAARDHFNEGKDQLKHGTVDDAVGSFQKAVALNPKNRKYQKALAEAKTLASYRALERAKKNIQRDPVAAQENVRQALSFNPTNDDATQLAAVLQQRFTEAKIQLNAIRAKVLEGELQGVDFELAALKLFQNVYGDEFENIERELRARREVMQLREAWRGSPDPVGDADALMRRLGSIQSSAPAESIVKQTIEEIRTGLALSLLKAATSIESKSILPLLRQISLLRKAGELDLNNRHTVELIDAAVLELRASLASRVDRLTFKTE
jgi:tetratricopeptide (TPR) repeat protein